MDTAQLSQKFERIGARLKVAEAADRRNRFTGTISLDIRADRTGEFFQIAPRPGVDPEIEVLDVQPADRHLLLLVREGSGKSKYLCGHDERHWFVAGIPESASVGTVSQAKDALKPLAVQQAEARQRVKGRARNRRKNAAFVRQGEWFFLPVANLTIDVKLLLRNEPLSRGNGGKPHWADFCYRTGGELVYVCRRQPRGLTERSYRALLAKNNGAKNWGWTAMRRNPAVYVRGRIRHPDHNTITLHTWHQVIMNTEHQSLAMRNVAFLD